MIDKLSSNTALYYRKVEKIMLRGVLAVKRTNSSMND